jgi:hypothetical protein
MTPQFENGYALVIGVDENSVPRWKLPDVAKDVAAMVDVLIHPERCAYLTENVKQLQGQDATRAGIQPAEGATEVLVTDVMSYVARQVPVSARNQAHADQQPDFQLSGGSWPVAALLGGKGLGKGVEPPDPLGPPALAAPVAATTQVNTGGGAFVGCTGSV